MPADLQSTVTSSSAPQTATANFSPRHMWKPNKIRLAGNQKMAVNAALPDGYLTQLGERVSIEGTGGSALICSPIPPH